MLVAGGRSRRGGPRASAGCPMLTAGWGERELGGVWSREGRRGNQRGCELGCGGGCWAGMEDLLLNFLAHDRGCNPGSPTLEICPC